MIKYYIASRLENAPRVRELKAILDARGWRHTYDWTVHGSVQHAAPEVIREVAEREVEGVRAADVVIVLLPGGRGTHTELGIALAMAGHRVHYEGVYPQVQIVVLSESAEIDCGGDDRTCAFYHHQLVDRVSSWDELLLRLASMELREGSPGSGRLA